MLTTIGVIGDIHAEPERLRRSLDFLHSHAPDALLCVGDIVDGTGDVNACCDLLKEFQVQTVLGNHDSWILQNSMRDLPDATPLNSINTESLKYIQNLPIQLEFETPAGRLLLCHGLGKHLMAKVRNDDFGYALANNFELLELIQSRQYRYLINGHTHYRMARDFGGLTVINAGSLLYEDACCLMVNFHERMARFYGLESPKPEILAEKAI
jgi:putative phosphoesterase